MTTASLGDLSFFPETALHPLATQKEKACAIASPNFLATTSLTPSTFLAAAATTVAFNRTV
jgi:hypothetical protein